MKAPQSSWLKFSYVGFQIMAAIILFGWIGYTIDSYFSLYPYGFIISLVIGSVTSLYGIWKDSKKY
tara:strand:- start:586 stop:783 length:198 start_codon:yes stop_codon:yes gene_type:complete